MTITFFKLKLFTYFCCVVALACTAHGQSPTAPPEAAAPTASTAPVVSAAVTPPTTPTLAPVATVAATVAPSASPATEEDFDSAIEKKIRKHFKVDLDGGHPGNDDIPWIAVPIVLIVFLSIFGVPVMIVGLIMYFSFSKSRALHKTVRMMVEKGQPVPEALLNPPPVVRQRSDLRRGIILSTVGAGLIVLLGALNDWEGGIWSVGMIPFLIGLGYLLVWRLDVHKEDPSPKV